MAVSVGDKITAAQYNGLQSRVASILGTGSGNEGYGQSVTSSQVSGESSPGAGDGDLVTAANMNEVWTDMDKCWQHIYGVNLPLRNFSTGDVIGADASGTGLTYAANDTYTFDNQDNTGGFNDYLAKMTEIETDRFLMDDGEDSIDDIAASVRTASWNGTINCTFRCTFNSADERRHFFNAGGYIYIELSGENGSGAKDTDWNSMITNPGQVQFGYNYTTVSGSTTGVTLNSIGNFDVTSTTFTTIFTKTGNADVYAENDYIVQVRQALSADGGAAALEFRVILQDDDTGDQQSIEPGPFGPAEDEDVTLDITATLGGRRANGAVVLPHPSVTVVDQL
jgi:hypothetical protein